MRKIFISLVIYSSFIALSVLLTIVKIPAANAQSSCTIEITPTTGYLNKTQFNVAGTTNTQLNPQQSRIDIVDETRKKVIRSLGFSTLNKDSFSVDNFGPFSKEGRYHLNLFVPASKGQTLLCLSNTIEIVPLPTPTPGGPSVAPTPALTCNPPGRNPNDLSKCADFNCFPIRAVRSVSINSPCEPFGVIVPTPTPTEIPSHLPPCAEWVYNFPKDNNDSRLNGVLVPTGNPEYIDPNFKTRKCIAINTAIGSISTEPQGFVKRIFSLVLGIAGGIALILIIISGYRMMVSQGNPEAVNAARDQLISAIVGLLFIIFSFVILQVIGVDILKIPGFTQ